MSDNKKSKHRNSNNGHTKTNVLKNDVGTHAQKTSFPDRGETIANKFVIERAEAKLPLEKIDVNDNLRPTVHANSRKTPEIQKERISCNGKISARTQYSLVGSESKNSSSAQLDQKKERLEHQKHVCISDKVCAESKTKVPIEPKTSHSNVEESKTNVNSSNEGNYISSNPTVSHDNSLGAHLISDINKHRLSNRRRGTRKNRRPDIAHNHHHGYRNNSDFHRFEYPKERTSKKADLATSPRLHQHLSLSQVQNSQFPDMQLNNPQMLQHNWTQQKPTSMSHIASSAQQRLLQDDISAREMHRTGKTQLHASKNIDETKQTFNPISNSESKRWTPNNSSNCANRRRCVQDKRYGDCNFNKSMKVSSTDEAVNRCKKEQYLSRTKHSSDQHTNRYENVNRTKSSTKTQCSDAISRGPIENDSSCKIFTEVSKPKPNSSHENCNGSASNQLYTQFENVSLECNLDCRQINSLSVRMSTEMIQSPNSNIDCHIVVDEPEDKICSNNQAEMVSQILHPTSDVLETVEHHVVEHCSSVPISCDSVPDHCKVSIESDKENTFSNAYVSNDANLGYGVPFKLDFENNLAETNLIMINRKECKLFPDGQQESDSRSNIVCSTQPNVYNPTVCSSQVQDGETSGQNLHQRLKKTDEIISFEQCMHSETLILSNNMSESLVKITNEIGKVAKINELTSSSSLSSVTPNREMSELCTRDVGYIADPIYSNTLGDCLSGVAEVCSTTYLPEHIAVSPKQNPGFGSLRDEIDEEMTLAKSMKIPINIEPKKRQQLNVSDLNPDAQEFTPTLCDYYGHSFEVTNKKGVSYFRPHNEHFSVNRQVQSPLDSALLVEPMTERFTSDSAHQSETNENYGGMYTPTINESVFTQSYLQTDPAHYARFELPQYNCSSTSVEASYNEIPPSFNETHLKTPGTYTNVSENTPDQNNHAHTGTEYSAFPNTYVSEIAPDQSTNPYTGTEYSAFPNPYVSEITPDQSNNPYTGTEYSAFPNPYCQFNHISVFHPILSPSYCTEIPPATGISNEQVQSNTPIHYRSPVYPAYSFSMHLPPFVTTNSIPLSRTDYRSFMTPSHAVPEVRYPVSAPTQTSVQHPFYSTPESTIQSQSGNSNWTHAPVFNLHAFYKANLKECSTEITHEQMKLMKFQSSKDPSQKTDDSKTSSELSFKTGTRTTFNESQLKNNINNSQYQASLLQEINAMNLVSSTINSSNKEVHNYSSHYHLLASDNVIYNAKSATNNDDALFTGELNLHEFEECKKLIQKLSSQKISLDQFRTNFSSEPEIKRYMMERRIQLALEVIEGSRNTLTVDEMARTVLLLLLYSKGNVNTNGST